jgi:hypothetical protein
MCSNCAKTGHAEETCHIKKREEPLIPAVPTKIIEPVVKVTTQLFEPTTIPLRYPCIICFSFKHCGLDCPKKIEVQNMF